MQLYQPLNSKICSIRYVHITFVKKSHLKIISFQNYKQWYLIHTQSDKAFKLCMEGHLKYLRMNVIYLVWSIKINNFQNKFL